MVRRSLRVTRVKKQPLPVPRPVGTPACSHTSPGATSSPRPTTSRSPPKSKARCGGSPTPCANGSSASSTRAATTSASTWVRPRGGRSATCTSTWSPIRGRRGRSPRRDPLDHPDEGALLGAASAERL